MKYKNYTIVPVLFHRYSNLISKGIRTVTNSYWNHCGFIVIDGDGKEMFTEAVESGVLYMTLENMILKYKDIAEIKYLEPQTIVNDYKDCLADKYAFNVFGTQLSFYICKHILGEDNAITKKISNKDIKNAWFCFEYLGYVLGRENYWNFTGRDFSNLDKNGNIIYDK